MQSKDSKKKGKSCLIIVAVVFLLLIIAIVVTAFLLQNWYYSAIVAPNSTDKSVVEFEINPGTNAQDIGKLLKEKGLIENEYLWQAYVKLNNPNLLADEYALAKNLSIVDLVSILEKGQKDEVIWVTIPEGLRMDEIEQILDSKLSGKAEITYTKSEFNKLITKPDEFLKALNNDLGNYILQYKPSGKSLEGFLFPDTYAFRTDVDTKKVLQVLLENFMNKTKSLNIANDLSFYNNLVVASIVEREAAPADHAGVASVFLKRIAANDKLGSDITVLYILKRWRPEPTAKELTLESPYNTRKNYGIPPTPISNPGIAAISATANATVGANYYFLADENGKVHYGVTLADHNKNICLYLTKTCK